MDPGHLWMALRYAELNPMRAGLALEAAEWTWSSAAAHCGVAEPDAWIFHIRRTENCIWEEMS